MATVAPARRRRAESFRAEEARSFRIHEDAPSTEDTEMNESAPQDADTDADDADDADDDAHDAHARTDARAHHQHHGHAHPADDDAQDSEYSDSDEDDAPEPSSHFTQDMENLQNCFAGFRHKYRLIKRIGEGTFSTVYKAEDLQYDRYDNSWDLDKETDKWTAPPLKSFSSESSATLGYPSQSQSQARRRPKYVAIKKIYVTSSPTRILNELELLHDLRGCKSVCPLITAFRWTDQVVAILPYFRHADFRDYFRNMTVPDIAIYLRSLFTALASVHHHNILHRDIKPTNFLYDPSSRRGVLVDFGLAEREGYDCKPCLCHDDPAARKAKLRPLITGSQKGGYLREDTRPSRRANRAGTRGFRAPEVLFKCTEQSTKIDIWSAGVILLTILSRRFPFFNSADDVEAMIEIATMFGRQRMQAAALLHGCMLETTIPTIGRSGFSFEGIILWSTSRNEQQKDQLSEDEKLAIEFLGRCLELDPSRRISAEEALQHEFLRMGLDDESVEGGSEGADDDEMDILKA
ncbi:kinase-like domain-containing protein [Staphylotrichum tortipilum]|uniref:non-specific serine/threonine protein kinase n=1 Tax=Staphylotrichum tortipilum TaxID=2831512 RepID=A0AAN6MDU8_9PEZI|nr:kinase-like domain-containing protein [Staphylotrichum longicolle]